MMIKDAPEKVDSKFRYVLLVASRAEQLMRGARPKMEVPAAKPTRLAMEEVNSGAVEWEYGLAEEPEEPLVETLDVGPDAAEIGEGEAEAGGEVH